MDTVLLDSVSKEGSCSVPPEPLIEELLKYQPDAPVEAIRKAYRFARDAHAGELRASGEPYITHPLEVARLLAHIQMDAISIQAALLHDVVEDTSHSIEDIRTEFGDDVAALVDGVTKLSRTSIQPREPSETLDERRSEQEARRHAENLRKIVMAMARDVRVMVIKLADRLHNMRTLSALDPVKQHRIARETLEIFAPIAHRLGMGELKWELEDLSFKYLYPEEFGMVAERVSKTRASREGAVRQTMDLLKQRLQEAGIDATIQGRPKHLWSIFNKMREQRLDFEAIYDLIALRVIVYTIPQCYQALGIVHEVWMPIPNKFDDYIAKPKGNMYRSLHTKVIGSTNEPVEIQIRTWDMHRTSEFGVAAHWQYKEGGKPDVDFETALQKLRTSLIQWQTDTGDATQFLKAVSDELFREQVFVFTPKHDVIDLPTGSTPVDFAFRIHSDLGLKCYGARVNERIVPLSHVLQNGDIVSVMTRANATPSLDWLHFVKTGHARDKIRIYFKKLHGDENTARGRELLRAELERLGLEQSGLLHSAELAHIAERMKLANVDALLASIGYGRISVDSIVNRLRETLPTPEILPVTQKAHSPPKLDISVGGASGILIRRAPCCLPLPGDDVVGYVTRGRGMAIHRRTCPNALAYAHTEPDRLTDVNWPVKESEFLDAPLVLVVLSRMGVLNEITTVFSQTRTNIAQAKASEGQSKMGLIEITAEVTGLPHLDLLMSKLQSMPDIIRIDRGPISRSGAPSRRIAPHAARRVNSRAASRTAG